MHSYKNLIDKVLNAACTQLGIDENSVNANINFVSVKDIKNLNFQHRGIDKITDVLSFPALNIKAGTVPTYKAYKLDFNRETNKLELGDIAICSAVAKKQADEYGHSLQREIAFLFLHGFLHLLGYDHLNETDEIKMVGLQKSILEKAGIER